MTILANLAKDPGARVQMLQSQGLNHLIRILDARSSQTNPSAPQDTALQAATERTVSKAAIAVARLCQDPVSANTAVELGGLKRLQQLVSAGPLSSNESAVDAVHVAAAAAIKTISIYSTTAISDPNTVGGLEGHEAGHLELAFLYSTDTNQLSSLESFV